MAVDHRSAGRNLTRRRLLGSGVAGAALALAACGRAGQSASKQQASNSVGKPRVGGKLSGTVTSDPSGWDLTYSKTPPLDHGCALAYEGLLGAKHGPNVNYEDLVIQPELATKWETPDAQTYTFHLRQGVKFANLPPVNGRELTSADIKWSCEYNSRTGELAGKKL